MLKRSFSGLLSALLLSALLLAASLGVGRAPSPASATRPATTQASKPAILFNGIPWGASKAVVKASLPAGFTLDEAITANYKNGDLYFTGKLLNENSGVMALFDPNGKLVKVGVILYTKDQDARSRYASTQEMLISKYGKPTDKMEDYSAPYQKGDGYEDTALKLGKGVVLCTWKDDAGTFLAEKISDTLTVLIQYEPSTWDAEYARRQKETAKQF